MISSSNVNINPIQMLEISNFNLYNYSNEKKLNMQIKLKILYKSSRISEIIDNFRHLEVQDMLIKKFIVFEIEESIFNYSNFKIFWKSAYFFFIEI